MFPPHNTKPTRLPRKRSRCFQQRRKTGGASALDHGLFDFEQQHNRFFDIAFVDQQNFADQFLHDQLRECRPGSFTAMPSAMVLVPNCGVSPLIAQYIDGNRWFRRRRFRCPG